MPKPPDDATMPARVQQLIANISRRIAPLCQHMPAEQFTAMVRRMAELEYKYETLGSATRDLRRRPSRP